MEDLTNSKTGQGSYHDVRLVSCHVQLSRSQLLIAVFVMVIHIYLRKKKQ